MQVIFTDPSVQAAIIEAVGGIVATTIAAIAAALIGQKFAHIKRLKARMEEMQSDLCFLLAVEEEHCRRNGQKLTVRQCVRKRGHSWTGKFTPGRAKVQ